jgi:hypothetical protein
MRPEKNKFKLEADEGNCRYLQANENQMEFAAKIKSELSGKKWDKSNEIYPL